MASMVAGEYQYWFRSPFCARRGNKGWGCKIRVTQAYFSMDVKPHNNTNQAKQGSATTLQTEFYAEMDPDIKLSRYLVFGTRADARLAAYIDVRVFEHRDADTGVQNSGVCWLCRILSSVNHLPPTSGFLMINLFRLAPA